MPTNNSDLTVYRETVTHMISNPTYRDKYMFYGFLIAQLTPIAREFEAPAGITFIHDHYVLYINPKEFDKFTLVERMGVIIHECLHVLNGHVYRKEDRDHMKFNYSADCAINQHIDRDHLPKGCIYPDNLPTQQKSVPEGHTAEQYYELLDDIPDDDDGSGLIDNHDVWDEATGDEDLQKDITKDMLDKSVSSTEKNRGTTPSNLSEYMELHSRKNEVDWRKLVKRMVSNKKANTRSTIMRSSRRFPKREDIKGKTKDRTFELIIVGDESGSVSDTELIDAIAEVQHICKLSKTPLWYIPVDSRAHKPQELTHKQRSFNRSACGGTNLNPAIQCAKDHKIPYKGMVVITDGYLCTSDVQEFANTNLPIIWLITSQGTIMPEMNVGLMSAHQLKPKD